MSELKLIDTDNNMGANGGKTGWGLIKEVKYMVREEDLTLGGGHTM